MPNKTNQEWIQENNTRIDRIKNKVDALPDYSDPTDATYAELFAIADNIYNPDIPDDSTTANFTIDDEQICLQRALKILKGAI